MGGLKCKGVCITRYDTKSNLGGNPWIIKVYSMQCRGCGRRFKPNFTRCPCCNQNLSKRKRTPLNNVNKPRVS